MSDCSMLGAKNKELKASNQKLKDDIKNLLIEKESVKNVNTIDLENKNSKLSIENETAKTLIKELNLKVKSLLNSNTSLAQNVELLKKDKEELVKENLDLKNEVHKYKPIVEKFTQSSEKLNLILSNQRAVFNKAGLGYKTNKQQKYLKNFFVKAKDVKTEKPTCFHCGKTGHKVYSCIQRKIQTNKSTFVRGKNITKVWVPKGTNYTNQEGPKKTWVPKSIT